MAVDAVDFTVDRRVVPTYVVAEGEDGEKEALHHVKDAEEISDVIRQARTDENGDPAQIIWTPDFNLEGWYWDNYTPNLEPGFYVVDNQPPADASISASAIVAALCFSIPCSSSNLTTDCILCVLQ